MSWLERVTGSTGDRPRFGQGAAIVGVAMGVALFLGPTILLGARHAGLIWVVAWAMLWSPAFCLVPVQPGASEAQQIARFLGALLVTTLALTAALSLPYLAGCLL